MILPTGIVTFLFTDIEGSTRLWEDFPEAMRSALARHDALLQEAIEQHNGHVFKTVGDAFCAAFVSAQEALEAALEAQIALQNPQFTLAENRTLRVRMALHAGPAEERAGDYFGPTLNRIARLLATGHGGQVLLSQTVEALARNALPAGAGLKDLGRHRLKDLQQPEQVFQLLHPALPADFPKLKSLNPQQNNLPQQLTSFVGRETEIAAVERLLADARLLTLTGPGGAGKTRLALQVAAETVDQYPDGVWLVELAPLSDPALVPQEIASALDIREEAGRALAQTLVEQLSARQLLLVLDNCEHLVEACAQLADRLTRACPQLKILASSRERLGVAGEITYAVPSLSLPTCDPIPPLETLLQYEAVRLFVERASAVLPGFVPTPANAPALVQICRRLDGIPLAIELAAARVKVLPVEQIARRLDDRFRLLTGGSRTALPHHQTLRATIDWSYNLLKEPERTLLRRLSVFAGGWTLEAAEAICADTPSNLEWEGAALTPAPSPPRVSPNPPAPTARDAAQRFAALPGDPTREGGDPASALPSPVLFDRQAEGRTVERRPLQWGPGVGASPLLTKERGRG